MADFIAEATLEFEPTNDSFQLNVQTIKADGNALNGARVSISGPVEVTEQSSGGYAVFQGIPPGDYDITGHASGFSSASTSIQESDFVEQ